MDKISPKLSIITVNLNNAEGLRKTLDSVAAQTFTNYEHLIIDGGSTDGSVEVIKKYEKQFNGIKNGLYWVSEPDKGIYNAMNKGIKVAKGEYCLFLNSGDWLIEKNGLKKVFNLNPKEDIIYGNLRYSNNKIICYPKKLSLFTFFKGTIGHPASFIKKALFDSIGLYNEELKIVSDWEFFIKAIILNQCSYKHIDILLTEFDLNGISSNEKYKSYQNKEREKTLQTYFSTVFNDYQNYILQSEEIAYYRNSRIVQLIKKIQSSRLYKQIRNIK